MKGCKEGKILHFIQTVQISTVYCNEFYICVYIMYIHNYIYVYITHICIYYIYYTYTYSNSQSYYTMVPKQRNTTISIQMNQK